MTYLDLTASQAAALARDGVVERWVRMEKQPGRVEYGPGGEPWDPTTGDILPDPPHPPGTRARVREPLRGDGQPGNKRVGITRYAADGEMVLPCAGCGMVICERQDGCFAKMDCVWEWDTPTIEACECPDSAIRTEAVCKSVTPEVRDGDGWGFVERWEVVRSLGETLIKGLSDLEGVLKRGEHLGAHFKITGGPDGD